MPGVLPLKTIQLNSSSQSRIAQACDRCRSKKIRCDGIQPNCTPCQAVNFDCKTSDKLSRKAYPKGYTSSLEERVRELETEIRQLKDLLDEKDEKIDILSKMGRSSSGQISSPTPPASTPSDHGKEDSFKVRQKTALYGRESGSEYFMGASSSRAFVDVFKSRVQEAGKLSIPFDTASLFPTSPIGSCKSQQLISPPRVVSDQLINVFFQEWAPLFPVLHRPTFLQTYEAFLSSPILKDPRRHAQMYLVFGIAALSSLTSMDLLSSYEAQWRKALDAARFESSIETLQCFVLAQLYCIIKGDNKRLMHYTGVAVNMAYRLGLHQSQTHFNLGALTRETRKKIFWSLYTLDCFSAATLGLPKLLKDADIETEDPADVDDENVSERGFQATLPGEYTKVSSALALFRASRLLSKVLDEVYRAGATHEVALSRVNGLSDELDAWRESLPQHLRLEFTQDTINVNVTSNRSPILALVYFHIRSCIHRPVVVANLGNKAMTSILALADSSKRIFQIMKLLEQRQMSFTMPINRTEILSLAGVSLLFQALNLRADGKLIRENQKLVAAIAELLSRASKPASSTLIKMSCTLLGPDNSPSPPRRSSAEGSMSPPNIPARSGARDQLQAIAARFSFSGSRNQKKSPSASRRGTGPTLPASQHNMDHPRSNSSASVGSARSAASDPMVSSSYETTTGLPVSTSPPNLPNLDFFQIGSGPHTPDLSSSLKQPSGGEWDHLINPYYPYDAQTPTGQYSHDFLGSDTFSQVSPPALTSLDWSPSTWNHLETSVSSAEPLSATAHSVLSFSDESLTSAEDLSSCELGSDYPAGLVIPADEFSEMPDFSAAGEYRAPHLTA